MISNVRFPLDIVFRIYDNVLATGIEAIFGFSIVLLQKNEDALLALKFDEILGFFKTRLFERYLVSQHDLSPTTSIITPSPLLEGSQRRSFRRRNAV